MKSQRFIVGFLAAIVLATAISLYMRATVDKVDKTFTASVSPDGRYKAVRLSLSRGGKSPFCFHSISIFLSVYPDNFAESEKAYQVFAQPCATPANPAEAPQVVWLSNTALSITYKPAPPGFNTSKLRRRVVDASNFVHITYVVKE